MAFDLYIKIGGLCLLEDTGSELWVLLPDTRGHEEHFPVIGADRRFQPLVTPSNCRNCANDIVECPISGGEIVFDPFDTSDPYRRPNFDKFDIVNLQTAAKKPPTRSKAPIRMRIPNGGIAEEVEDSHPARWFWKPRLKNMLMATFITWKVTGLTNKIGDAEGLRVRFGDRTMTLRPETIGKDRLIGMHLFHVVNEERPCAPVAGNIKIEPGKPAPHFSVLYNLFTDPAETPDPLFCNDGTQENCEQPEPAALGPRFLSIGLRYTCIMGGAGE